MRDRLVGILLGTAAGDALGLPAEGLSPRRRTRLFPGPWRHRFLQGRGMVSDDTEHTLFVAQSLLNHPSEVSAFPRTLAWRLRWWFLGLPAGVGLATARACIKLCLGFPPTRSGVFSAGNGPTMRSATLGTLEAVLECGGDTDTTGAIAGALAGATVGENGIPQSWLTGIVDWPHSLGLLRLVAERLALQRQSGQPLERVSYFWTAVLLRNLLFW